ncbi:carbohydrate binding domain-containing protein [Nonomuraea salmonea]|uniref:carbohydrate binding domain-containing protein n=1 Tax=Nonomuraea salmonea TaxID=46181 RepID=UPI0036145162
MRFRAPAVLLAAALVALPATPAHAADIARNPGFESGLTGWTCSGAETVTAPVHGGARALRATPQGNDLARCEQAVTVLPNTVYELSAWVQGAYVFLGATGSGVSASTWASPGAAWSQLRTSFTTGPATTSVTVYVNGWYGQGPYLADDVQLDGPGGGPEDTQALPSQGTSPSATRPRAAST